MSETFNFSIRNKKESNDPPYEVDINQSILELRNVYHSMTDVEFTRMYQKRYRVPASRISTVLHVKDEVLKASPDYPYLSQTEFVDMFSKQQRIKPALVRTVLEICGKG